MTLANLIAPQARMLVESRLDSISPFPKIVLDILTVLDDEEANASLLVDHLHRDPVLSGRLIGQANVTANRLASQRTVSDVTGAVAMLGFSRVRTLVSTLAVHAALDTKASTADHFWGHSIDVATASKVIAEHAGLKPEFAYIAGLLHDIGALWIATNFPDKFTRVATLLEAPEHHILEAESELVGANHAEVGVLLCEHWGLPADICLPVAGHHNPDKLALNPYVMAIHLAEMTCNGLNLGQRKRNIVAYLSEQALPALNLAWPDIPDLLGEIEARARFMRRFSGVSVSDT